MRPASNKTVGRCMAWKRQQSKGKPLVATLLSAILLPLITQSCAPALMSDVYGDFGIVSLRASRAFVGPHGYPPVESAAYGIVAFPQRAMPDTHGRYVAICETYAVTLPDSGELDVPRSSQMITVWPVEDSYLARQLNYDRSPNVCPFAVEHYDLPTAQQALRDAAKAGVDFSIDREGPFLLAWAPSSQKGREDALVLTADLSGISDPAKIREVFRGWREDIEKNPELWQEGWSLEGARIAVRDWADKYGPSVLKFWETFVPG